MAELIEIEASCPGDPQCRFDGEDMPVAIRLTNVSDGPLALPLGYVRSSGVFVTLSDPETGAELPLPRGVPRTDLLDETTTLAPGESVVIDWLLTPAELTQFGRDRALQASIEVMSGGLFAGRPVEARAKDRLTIRVP